MDVLSALEAREILNEYLAEFRDAPDDHIPTPTPLHVKAMLVLLLTRMPYDDGWPIG